MIRLADFAIERQDGYLAGTAVFEVADGRPGVAVMSALWLCEHHPGDQEAVHVEIFGPSHLKTWCDEKRAELARLLVGRIDELGLLAGLLRKGG